MTDTKHETKRNASLTPGPWRYEASTQTIRSVPANYWLATMDSFDGAVNHEANAHLIAAAPELLEALAAVLTDAKRRRYSLADNITEFAKAAIAKATGKELAA